MAQSQSVTAIAGQPVSILLSGTDADGDALRFAVATDPGHGVLSGIAPALTYLAAASYRGSDSFTFTVNDGTLTSPPATVTITVSAAPAEPTSIPGTPTPTPTFIPTSNPGAPTPTATPSQPTSTPVPTISPGGPTPSPTPTPTRASTATPTPSGTNRAPVASSQAVTIPSQTASLITLLATDADGNSLTYAIVNAPAHGALTGTAPNVTYTSAVGYAGADSFTFKANDGIADSALATVAITVTSATSTALIEIMMPTNGCVENYARPDLGAHFAGTTPVRPDSFRVYLDGHDFSAEAMIEDGEVMFMPKFDLGDGAHTYRVDWMNAAGGIAATDTAAFTVSASITGTHFEGEVRDYNGAPLAGVVVKASGQQTTTASNGKYAFENLPVGESAFHFLTDRVAGPFKYAPVTLAFEVAANRRTRWARPVYLPIVDESKGVLVHTNWPTDQVVSNPDIPGVTITIPANTTVTFPSGAPQAVVTLIDIPVFRTPNCLGAGTVPTRLYATQPENTQLSQPARLEFPNDLNSPEGARSALWNLNKQNGRYMETGVLEVKSGKVVSMPGSGLMTFDWLAPYQVATGVGQTNNRATKSAHELVETVCSSSATRLGTLEEDHMLPAYQSLGAERSVGLHYNSLLAAPTVMANAALSRRGQVNAPSQLRFSAVTPFGSASTYYAPVPSASLAADVFAGAAMLDVSSVKTGNYPLTTRATSLFPFPAAPGGSVEFSDEVLEQVTVVNGNELFPALGRGWSIGNVDRLVSAPGGDVIRVGGRGEVRQYKFAGVIDSLATASLGFELDSLTGFFRADGAIIPNLGFIRPPEGDRMFAMAVDPNEPPDDFDIEDGPAARVRATGLKKSLNLRASPPAADLIVANGFNAGLILPMPVTTSSARISFKMDLLTTKYVEDISRIVRLEYDSLTGGPLLLPRSDGPVSTLLPGGDTGYAFRTGFREYVIEVPAGMTWPRGRLTVYLTALGGVFAGALVDDIKVERGTRLPTSFSSFASEPGDFSSLIFDPAAQQYVIAGKDGSTRTFDVDGREISTADRWGNSTRYAYTDGDGDGKANELASITDPTGLVTTLSYSGGKLTGIADPAGRTTTFSYTAGGLTRITSPDGTTRSFTYDAQGKMTSQSDGKGQARRYDYSTAGRLASVTRADGSVYDYIAAQEKGLPATGSSGFAAPAPIVRSRQAESLTPNGQLTSRSLDKNGQVTAETDALGRVTNVIYGAQRLPLSMQLPNGRVTDFQYDSVGNPTSITEEFNGASSRFTYGTVFNLVTSASDPLSRITTYQYDAKGSLTKLIDPLGQMVLMSYNSRGQMTSVTDRRGKTSSVTYDASGQKNAVTDPLGRVTSFVYDIAGNLAAIRDPLGHTTTMAYDPGNTLLQVTTADGGVTRFTYDANKDVIKVTDPLGRETLTEYDLRRRPIKVTDALGRVTTMSYDAVDNLVETVDPAGGHWGTTYNAMNLATVTRDPLNQQAQFFYDAVDNVTRIVRPDGVASTATFDRLSRLTSAVAADGATTSYSYDLADQRTRVTDALGGTSSFTYDVLGRMLTTKDPLNRTTTLTYDASGQVTKIQRPDNTSTLSQYDDAGQLTQLTAADGGVVGYGYDAAGNLTMLTDANNHTRQFGYDALNRRSSETDALGRTSAVVRDLNGNVTQQTRRDGAVIGRSYDLINRLVQVNLPVVNGLPADTQTFSYDGLGNVTAAADNDSRVVTSYDALSRPISTTQTFGGNAQTLAYTYDTVSRRTTMTDVTGTTRYAYDNRDRLMQLTDPASRAYTFGYDALSRTTSRLLPNGVASTLTYDPASQLLGLTHSKSGATLDSTTYTSAVSEIARLTREQTVTPARSAMMPSIE